MRRIPFILSLLGCSLFLPAYGQEKAPLPVRDKVKTILSPSTLFQGKVWDNPALYNYYSSQSVTDLNLGGRYTDRGNASLVQNGNKDLLWNARVNSFIRLNEKESVFGSASYENKHTKDIRWNENDDFDLLYPYVTGDSIGGFMQKETYRFEGGYARETGEWSLGGKIGYRAVSSYRDQDPRPRNIVSDLNISAGAARHIGSYRLGIRVDFQTYKQSSKISFLADKGSTPVYQMLGFGMHYVRFAGSQTSSQYKITRWGGSIDLLPEDGRNGWSATLSANSLRLVKELTSLYYLPLVKAQEYNLAAETAYQTTYDGGKKAGIRLTADYTSRKGTENLFGDATGNSYPVIGKTPGFKLQQAKVLLSAFMERPTDASHTWGWSLQPETGFYNINANYETAKRSFRTTTWQANLQGQLQRAFKRTFWTVSVTGGYAANLSNRAELTGMDTKASSSQAVMHNIAYLSDNYWNAGASLRADYPLNKAYDLYLQAGWQTQQYKACGNTQQGTVSIGFIF